MHTIRCAVLSFVTDRYDHRTDRPRVLFFRWLRKYFWVLVSILVDTIIREIEGMAKLNLTFLTQKLRFLLYFSLNSNRALVSLFILDVASREVLRLERTDFIRS